MVIGLSWEERKGAEGKGEDGKTNCEFWHVPLLWSSPSQAGCENGEQSVVGTGKTAVLFKNLRSLTQQAARSWPRAIR